MNWIQKNFKKIIYASFLVPIITVAIVSISHVTKWYGLSNPVSWAVYLSLGVEIAALSALAAISAKMGKKVYLPFIIVTLIQFIGNIFFAYQYIDVTNESFKDWVDMVDPIVSFMGVESGNMIGHKRFLALFAGGMLPLISLSFLHMLVKFEEEEKKTQVIPVIEAEQEKENNTPTEEVLLKPSKNIQNETETVTNDEISDWDVTLMDGLEEENFEPVITFGNAAEKPKINRLVYTRRDG
jgi:hypothetical protein